jgi:hypothetical protein
VGPAANASVRPEGDLPAWPYERAESGRKRLKASVAPVKDIHPLFERYADLMPSFYRLHGEGDRRWHPAAGPQKSRGCGRAQLRSGGCPLSSDLSVARRPRTSFVTTGRLYASRRKFFASSHAGSHADYHATIQSCRKVLGSSRVARCWAVSASFEVRRSLGGKRR